MLIILSYLTFKFGAASIFLQIILVIFNLVIYLISLRENEKELFNSEKNEKSFVLITH